MNKFFKFLATNPVGTALKVGAGAALVWLIDNAGSLNLPPVVQVAIVAAAPVLINYINPADGRYGNGSAGVK